MGPSFIGSSVGLTGSRLKASARVTFHLRFPVEFFTTVGAVKESFHEQAEYSFNERCFGLYRKDA